MFLLLLLLLCMHLWDGKKRYKTFERQTGRRRPFKNLKAMWDVNDTVVPFTNLSQLEQLFTLSLIRLNKASKYFLVCLIFPFSEEKTNRRLGSKVKLIFGACWNTIFRPMVVNVFAFRNAFASTKHVEMWSIVKQCVEKCRPTSPNYTTQKRKERKHTWIEVLYTVYFF